MAVGRRTALCLAALIAISSIAAGCGDEDGTTDRSADDTWGPLAVLDGAPSGDDALIAGALHIGESCVTLDEGADEQVVLLVWPSEGTTWNSQSRVIEYTDGDRTVELSDGEQVALGGGGDSADEGGLTATEWIDSVNGWVAEPDSSCPTEERWFVGGPPPTGSVDP